MSSAPAAVLGWIVTRPIGRWHQSFVITDEFLILTPEISFTNNEELKDAAAAGEEELKTFLRGCGWLVKLKRCRLDEINGMSWNETTGILRVKAGDEILGATIAQRDEGTALEPKLKQAIRQRLAEGRN